MQNERLQRLTNEYSKLWKRRGSISYSTFITPDDLQDAYFHIASTKLDSFDQKENGQAYIYMVAKSKARKRLKKLSPLYVDTFDLREDSEEGFDVVVEDEYRKSINNYLDRQTFEDRQVLSKILTGKNWKSTAKEMGVSLFKLRYRYHDKIVNLKRILNGNN
jgi:DNA-directed RNA polymerase specialized sigma24 family protein